MLPQADDHAQFQAPNLFDPSLYINRELSWLEFNKRCLTEALDPDLPLLERIRFLAIFSNNLDEFYMVRVPGLKDQVTAAWTSQPPLLACSPHHPVLIFVRASPLC